ncbi:MAG: DNA polymerase III subunit chi [Rubrivivax sp.]
MLTGVEFHTGIPDPVAFVCRLLRKAQRQGHRAWVTADRQTLARLDEALWSFDALSFIPHVRVDLQPSGVSADPARQLLLDRTPIWLAEQAVATEDRSLLINVAADAPPDPTDWQRVIEIVAAEAEAAARGRARWRAWRDAGLQVMQHRMAATDA